MGDGAMSISEHNWPDWADAIIDPTGKYRCFDGKDCEWCGGLHYGACICPYSPAYKASGPWPEPAHTTLEYRCKDDPEANGRTPQRGEQRFAFTFPLEDGSSLRLYIGKETMNHFETFIAQMMVDDAVEEGR